MEIDLGASFANLDNKLYFTDAAQTGIFEFDNLDDVDEVTAFLHINIPYGKLGYLYTDLEYLFSKSAGGVRVPYSPAFAGEITYGFKLGNSIDISSNINYFGNSYADILNSVELDSFVDLSFIVKYEFLKNIKLTGEINNVLNKGNEFYKGYPEKSLDILGGIEYRW
jgi:hypothetical protein